jgi:hypothetical protein
MRYTIGDSGISLRVNPVDGNGATIPNITSAIVRIRQVGDKTAFDRTMTVLQDPAGQFEYIFAENDFSSVGQYEARVRITLESGQVVSSQRVIPIIVQL